MKTTSTFILSITLIVLSGMSAHGQDMSSIPGAFVDVGYGDRPVAMGNAYVGLADDVNAVYLNPAGLSFLDAPQIQFTHTKLMGLVDYNFVTAAVPFKGNQAVGVTFINSGDDLMREISGHLAYSIHVGQVSAGIAGKFRYSSFGNNTLLESDYSGIFDPDEITTGLSNQVTGDGSGYGLDLSALYKATENLTFGVMVRDVIAPFSWSSEVANTEAQAKGDYTEDVPFELLVGSSYQTGKSTFSVELRPSTDNEQDDAIRFGFERVFFNVLAARLGTEQWLNNMDDDKYMAGVGLNIPKMAGVSIRFNYSYVVDSLANTQRVGVQLHF